MIRTIVLLLITIFFLVTSTWRCKGPIDARPANQERSEPIIQAIKSYEQDHGQFPEELGVLVPTYLTAIPRTTTGDEFRYRLHKVDGYYLCFYLSRSSGCCYYQRLDVWDCTSGCE